MKFQAISYCFPFIELTKSKRKITYKINDIILFNLPNGPKYGIIKNINDQEIILTPITFIKYHSVLHCPHIQSATQESPIKILKKDIIQKEMVIQGYLNHFNFKW